MVIRKDEVEERDLGRRIQEHRCVAGNMIETVYLKKFFTIRVCMLCSHSLDLNCSTPGCFSDPALILLL